MTTAAMPTFLMNCGDLMTERKNSRTETATSNRSETALALQAILAFIARYRLATFDSLRQLAQFKTVDPGWLRRVLSIACQRDLMFSAPLHRNLRYWAFTKKGARLNGIPEDRSGPLSEVAKLHAYSMLLFCTQSGVPRTRLISRDFRQPLLLPLYRPGMPGTYYFSPEPSASLGLARLDGGLQGRWDRILHNVARDCQQHVELQAFAPFVESHRLEITIVTVLPEKADQLRHAVEDHADDFSLPVRIECFPALLPLVSNRNIKRSFL